MSCGRSKGVPIRELIFQDVVDGLVQDYLDDKISLSDCLVGKGPYIILEGFSFLKDYQLNNLWIPETVDAWIIRNKIKNMNPKIRYLLHHVRLMVYACAILSDVNL